MPSSFVVFDTETWHNIRAFGSRHELQTFRLAVACAFRYDRGAISRVKWLHTTDRGSVLSFILSRLSKRRPLWLVAHNLPYDLGAAGLWPILFREDTWITKLAVSSSVTWVKCTVAGLPLVLWDTCNYLHTSLESIGKTLGIAKLPFPDQSEPDGVWMAYCRRDVEVTVRAVTTLLDWWRQHDLGPWQPTVASAAFGAYRHRWMDQPVYVHDDRRALALERDAYYGGCVDTPYIGRVEESPVRELDVCSMYPSVCREDLPTRLVSYREGAVPVGWIERRGDHMVIADVTLETHDRTYPVRHGGKVYHARGKFRTSLADPELRVALSRGHVALAHRVAWYARAPIFKRYMEDVVSLKEHYSAIDNVAYSALCKLLAVSLYGKTGQTTPTWGAWGADTLALVAARHGLAPDALDYLSDHPPCSDETEWTYEIRDLGVRMELRQTWGVVEVRTGRVESRDSCPAIAACVTSYARCLLRRLQEIAGHGHWYYSDTDSLWVDDLGMGRLLSAGEVEPGVIGKLQQKGVYKSLIVHGPKDYEADGLVRLKGVKRGATRLGEDCFRQLQFPSALSQISRPEPNGVFVREVQKRLRRAVDRCAVGPGGWTRPYVFPQEAPRGKKCENSIDIP